MTANNAGCENRKRVSVFGNHQIGGDHANLNTTTSSTVVVSEADNDADMDRKYNKKAKTFLQRQYRKHGGGNRLWIQHHRKWTTAAQMAILLMLVATVLWTHEKAEERLRWHSSHFLVPTRQQNQATEMAMDLRRQQQQYKIQRQHSLQEPMGGRSNDEYSISKEEEHQQRGGYEDNSKESRTHINDKQQQHYETDFDKLSELSTNQLQELFLQEHDKRQGSSAIKNILTVWQDKANQDILNNVHEGIRWVRPNWLPPLPGQTKPVNAQPHSQESTMNKTERSVFFSVSRIGTRFKWEEEWEEMIQREKENSVPWNESNETEEAHTARIAQTLAQPVVDYTNKDKYQYLRSLFKEPPEQGYPQLTTMGAIMEYWDQHDDFEGIIMETLMHFNVSNPEELEMARKFRDADLPFKLTHVPQLSAANRKWTDEYISKQYDGRTNGLLKFPVVESSNQFLPRYLSKRWNLEWLGLPPTRQNDWTYCKWSQHAQYADAVQLSYDQPHFHVQPFSPEADSLMARDLPSETFMFLNASMHEGLVCRFSERGTVTSIHYDDSGRSNMVGVIAGAKRYILSPPTECSKLGTEGASPESVNPRHSYLNFGNLKNLNNEKSEHNNEKKPMSNKERAWLERASQAKAVETVLKTGEVLYLPPFWYHYIISLQKTTQCNIRSGNGPRVRSSSMARESSGEQNC